MEQEVKKCIVCNPEISIEALCNSCNDSLPNKSGMCSIRCRTGNGCDGTCHQERYRRQYQEKLKKMKESTEET